MTAYFRRILLFLLLASLFCMSGGAAQETVYTKFTRRAFDLFDTEISLTGFAPSQQAFDQAADEAFALLQRYDHIFDGYTPYEGLNNLYYVNLHAGEEPVEAPEELFNLLAWCKEKWAQGLKSTNVAMGAVLSLWHECREEGIQSPENARLPDRESLAKASGHVNLDDVILDPAAHTVFFSDPEVRLDIGAVAKGWAADGAAALLKRTLPSFLLSLGGNVYAGEAPLDGRSAWAVGVQNPLVDAQALAQGETQILDIVDVKNLTVVTSGDYWRYYVVDGERYHHIIDPETLFPSRKMLSVTVICDSSVLADFLSTTLFVLSYEEGLALVQKLPGVEILWVLPDGSIRSTPGMARFARSLKQ